MDDDGGLLGASKVFQESDCCNEAHCTEAGKGAVVIFRGSIHELCLL